MRRYLSKPDLAMSMGEPSHWFGGHNSWLTFVGVTAVLVVSINTIPAVHTVQILWIQISISENQFYFGKITNNKQKLLNPFHQHWHNQ